MIIIEKEEKRREAAALAGRLEHARSLARAAAPEGSEGSGQLEESSMDCKGHFPVLHGRR